MANPTGFLVVPLAFNPSGDIRALECDTDDILKVSVKELLTRLTVTIEPGVDPIITQVEPGVDPIITQVEPGVSPIVSTVEPGTNPIVITGQSPSLLKPTPNNGRFDNLSLAAGASVQQSLTIPASEYWRLTTFSMRYSGTIAGVTLLARVNSGGTSITFLYVPTVVNNNWYVQLVNILMKPGDILEVAVTGATLNDDLNICWCAERVY